MVTEPNLLTVCAIAFVSVLVLLSSMAVVIRLLNAFFPQEVVADDAAVHRAIRTAVASAYPGATVTRIEEVR